MFSFSYIFVFIAGQMILGALHAIIVVVSISSAMPFAIFPMVFAVAGATTKTSARFARATCSTSKSKSRSNKSVITRLPDSVSNDSGCTNSVECGVMITMTVAPFFLSELTISHALYAAIQPVTPKTTVLPLTFCSLTIFCLPS